MSQKFTVGDLLNLPKILERGMKRKRILREIELTDKIFGSSEKANQNKMLNQELDSDILQYRNKNGGTK